ncbi:MAG: tetraacyldisaccharide 4'-kinase [Candidatus Gastranaerophilales bacterium]|nr:tetraacyldisaccharide 4'-kinase [Candidatus Gastranaerophilales bacterium]
MKLFISKLHYKKKNELNLYEKSAVMFLRVIGVFYGIPVFIRNKLYDKKLLPAYNSKSFVVSVGNITTGGVGKTPLTLEIAKYYLSLNKKVAIISRGYGAKLSNKKPNLISDRSGALYTADIAGDEPVWLADNAKGAYVVTCASRIKAEKFIKEKYNPDIIILDDAFQHRKMKRDLDIMAVDANNKFGNGYMLPAGPLREDLNNIKRADKVIVVNKDFDSKNALKYCDYLKKRFKKPTYLCKIVPDCTYNIITNEILPKDTRIMAFSAIGQPTGFYKFLKNDYKLTAVLEFDDHHIYERDDVSKIIHYAQEENITHIVTTEKDAVKLKTVIKDVELPVKFYALKLKAYIDIKEVCGI